MKAQSFFATRGETLRFFKGYFGDQKKIPMLFFGAMISRFFGGAMISRGFKVSWGTMIKRVQGFLQRKK